MFVGVFSSRVLTEIRPPGSLLIVVVLMLECCDRSFRAASGCLQTARPQNSRFSKCKNRFYQSTTPRCDVRVPQAPREKYGIFSFSAPVSLSVFSLTLDLSLTVRAYLTTPKYGLCCSLTNRRSKTQTEDPLCKLM